jgi:uncharacterized protein
MLLQFSVSNYRCFRQLQTLNLAASNQDKSLPNNCILTDLPGLAGKRWTKGAALYGANASGKSTIINALKALADLVNNSAKTTDPKEPIRQIDAFALAPEQPETPTAFALSFSTEGVRYEYRVAATRKQIRHESLRAFPNKKEQLWFNREWNAETASYEWSPDRPSGFQRDLQLEGYTLPNMLFLSKAVASNRPELGPIFEWFKEKLNFLDLGASHPFDSKTTLEQVKAKSPIYERIIEFIQNADIGVTGAQVIDKSASDPLFFERPTFDELLHLVARDPHEPSLQHRAKGGLSVPLPWESESAGTQRLFGLAGLWLRILKNGQTVCVDELETSLHPLMARELLRLFFSAEENPKGAQILFTTHNPLLLDPTLLRRDQVWFTDKGNDGEAHLYPLTDYQPRKGESLVRGYMSGRYGAVPFVPAGLLGSFPAHDAHNDVEEKT